MPFDVENIFGSKRPKIKASINGIEYRGLLVRMKTPNPILGVLKEIRDKLNAKEGDLLQIEIQADTQLRVIEIPADFNKTLIQENLLSYFENLAFTHRKEFVRWIQDAKKAETRQRRSEKSIVMLKNKENLS